MDARTLIYRSVFALVLAISAALAVFGSIVAGRVGWKFADAVFIGLGWTW